MELCNLKRTLRPQSVPQPPPGGGFYFLKNTPFFDVTKSGGKKPASLQQTGFRNGAHGVRTESVKPTDLLYSSAFPENRRAVSANI